jgi:integrase/recombinase XerD
MNKLYNYLDSYLDLRQAMGFKLRTIKTGLRDFVKFADVNGFTTITVELALLWAMKPKNAAPKWWAYRLRMVYKFARFVNGRDPATEIPPLDLLPYHQRRLPPYIYSENQIVRVIEAARSLSSHNGLRCWTYATLFGLIWTTGLRLSEALGLDNHDVDLVTHLLHIRNTKFGKSRLVPLHPSTSKVLKDYIRRRRQVFSKVKSPSFFLTVFGTRPTATIVQMTFRQLCCEVGIRNPSHKKGPRIHDIRHTFAVRTLINLYKNGCDIEQGTHALSVYLGHVGPSSTYWYLSAVPELMEQACRHLERKGALI